MMMTMIMLMLLLLLLLLSFKEDTLVTSNNLVLNLKEMRNFVRKNDTVL